MTISEYKLKKDFRAPKINVQKGEFQSYFTFQKGNAVIGWVDESTGKKLLITTGNAYAIPLTSLDFVRDIEIDGEPVDYTEDEGESGSGKKDEGKTEMQKIEEKAKAAVRSAKVEVPKEYREQMDKIKKTNVVNTIVNKSRNSVNGIIIGGIAGLVISLITRQSKFGGMVLGAAAGGLIGYGITGDAKKDAPKPKESKTEPEKPKQDASK